MQYRVASLAQFPVGSIQSGRVIDDPTQFGLYSIHINNPTWIADFSSKSAAESAAQMLNQDALWDEVLEKFGEYITQR